MRERTVEELEGWIQSQEYPPAGGWFKARRLNSFYQLRADSEWARVSYLEAARTFFREYTDGLIDGTDVRRKIVSAYIWHELTGSLPESCSWDFLHSSDWAPAAPSQARALVEKILCHADEDPDYPMHYRERYPIDYPALRHAFLDELFDPTQVMYLVQRPTDPTMRLPDDEDLDYLSWEDMLGDGLLFGTDDPPEDIPAVVALDRRMIAIAWWE